MRVREKVLGKGISPHDEGEEEEMGSAASWPKGGYLRHNLRLSVYELQLMMLQALECAFLI